eukprot:3700652-Lingulodinium_polyedra.AAC.1
MEEKECFWGIGEKGTGWGCEGLYRTVPESLSGEAHSKDGGVPPGAQSYKYGGAPPVCKYGGATPGCAFGMNESNASVDHGNTQHGNDKGKHDNHG